MKLTLSKEHNINYVATVVKIKEILPIKGADNIVQVMVDGFSVVVDKSTKVGDVYIFCPIDSKLNSDLLRINNLYSTHTLNNDYLQSENKDDETIDFKRGFFPKNGKVKPITLRKTPSQGFLIKPEMLNFIENIDIDFNKEVGTMFDTIGDTLLLEKYVIPVEEKEVSIKINKKGNRRKAINDLVFHYNTSMFNRNLHNINETDEAVITVKLHGTSAIYSKRKYKPKSILQRIKKFLGLYRENVFINASRTRLREGNSIWNKVGNKIKNYLPDNVTVYGEIVGYNNYKLIQKDYDYGFNPNQYGFMPYRVVEHLEDGTIKELPMLDVVEFSKKLSLSVQEKDFKIIIPEVLYSGKLIDLVLNNSKTQLYNPEGWQDELLKILINKKDWFMEKNEPMCKNKVPREGIVIRVNGYIDRKVYKLKCQKFYEKESNDND